MTRFKPDEFWRCIACAHRRNKTSDLHCEVCHIVRAPRKLVVRHSDGLFLCATHVNASIVGQPTVSIFRVSPLPEIQFKSIIPVTGTCLLDCIKDILDSCNINDVRNEIESADRGVTITCKKCDERFHFNLCWDRLFGYTFFVLALQF